MNEESGKFTEASRPFQDLSAASRNFKRLVMSINPDFRLDALRPKQKGSYSLHEEEQFCRQQEPVKTDQKDLEVRSAIRHNRVAQTETVAYHNWHRIEC